MPVADTVASALLDDDQTAVAVTSCVVPSDIVAVALNCDVGAALTDGADPVTLSDDTVVVAVGVDEPPQAAAKAASATKSPSERFHSIMFVSKQRADAPPLSAASMPPIDIGAPHASTRVFPSGDSEARRFIRHS
jgi:hypothetical protein